MPARKYSTDAERREARRRQGRQRQRRRRARLRAEAGAAASAKARARREPSDPVAAFGRYVKTLTVPRGLRQGKRFSLMSWQEDFASLLFGEGCQSLGLSIARKNGKTGTLALLVLSRIDPASPLCVDGFRAVCIGANARISSITADAIMDIARASGIALNRKAGNRPCIESPCGSRRLDLLTAGRTATHGEAADWVVVDEAGLLNSRHDGELWASCMSSVSASPIGRAVFLGTRLKGDLFEGLLDQARREVAGVKALEFGCEADCDISDPAQWERANPGMSVTKACAYMERAAAAALDDPSQASAFLSHDLNAPVADDAETVVSLSDFRAVEVPAEDLPPREGRCWVGIDLGGSRSMTAAAVIWASGRLEHLCMFPARPALAERGRLDGVGNLYERMHRRRELAVSGGKLTDPAVFFQALAALVNDYEVAGVGGDRFRQSEIAAAVSGTPFEAAPWFWRGTGASAKADGSFDIRALQSMIYTGQISIAAGSLIWPFSIASSRLRFDSGGNPALDRSRARARQDLIAASAIACGLRALQRAADAGDEAPAVVIVN